MKYKLYFLNQLTINIVTKDKPESIRKLIEKKKVINFLVKKDSKMIIDYGKVCFVEVLK